LLVPPKDPEALARSLATLFQHPTLRAKLGKAGWSRVHEMFTWAKATEQIDAVYEKVLSQRPSEVSAVMSV
jgi:glycosyltransferase involved in cell wall biosynthesis